MEEDKIQVLRRSGDWAKYPIRNGDMSMSNTAEDIVDKSNLDLESTGIDLCQTRN